MTEKPRILLTGATGFIGNALLHELINQNYNVMVPVRTPERVTVNSPNLEIVACDICNPGDYFANAVKSFRPDVVIHSAWVGTENTNRNDPTFVLPNLQSSLRLLEIAADSGCSRFIGFGSQAEYSGNINSAITEQSPSFPESAYGISKLATCHMLQNLCEQNNISFIWLRIFASYGKNYKASYIMPYLIDCFRKQEMPVLKTPNAVWDYIHVNDVVSATIAAISKPSVSGIFNLASGKGYSVAEIALMTANICKFRDIEGLQKYIESANNSYTYRVANINKIKTALNRQPDISLEEGLLLCI